MKKTSIISIKVDFLPKYFPESTFMFIFAAEFRKDMERNLLIELLEDGEKVSLYSPHFEGEEYSEFEKFLLTYKDTCASIGVQT